MSAIRLLALCVAVLTLVYVPPVLGWIMDEKQRQTKLPTKGIDDEA